MRTKALFRACPICGNGQGRTLVARQFALWEGHPLRDRYDLVGCSYCGFVFADTENRQEDYDHFYRRLSKYEDSRTSTGGAGNIYDSRRLSRTAQDIAEVIHDKSIRILDLGCANGGLLRDLHALGYNNVVGIDPSPACARNTAKLLGIETSTGGLFDLPRAAGLFDLIILSHVLEHVVDLRSAMAGLRDALSRDGLLYVEVPDARRYTDYIVAPFQEFNMEHINHFTLSDLDNLLGYPGFLKLMNGAKIIEISAGMLYPAIFGFYKKTDSGKGPARKDIENTIMSYIERSDRIMEKIRRKMSNVVASSVIVWGCGAFTANLLQYGVFESMNIAAFVDSNPILTGKRLLGKGILHPSEIGDLKLNGDELIVIASTICEDSITDDIRTKYSLKNPVLGFRDCLL